MGMIYQLSTKNFLFDSTIPNDINWMGDGWSIVPLNYQRDISENFPFIEVETSYINDVNYVTSVQLLPKPELEQLEPPASQVDEITMLNKKVEALSERNDFLEDCIAEMAGVVYNYNTYSF